jgi:hypothetical protein
MPVIPVILEAGESKFENYSEKSCQDPILTTRWSVEVCVCDPSSAESLR